MKEHLVTILPGNMTLSIPDGENLLTILRTHGLDPESPCGGHGTCGKCRVTANGQEVLACRTVVTEELTVSLQNDTSEHILTDGIRTHTTVLPVYSGKYHLAYDIGTTTVVCYLLDGETGAELALASMRNPQSGYGADVISRIQYALQGNPDELTLCIREGMVVLAESVCKKACANPREIGTVSVVGNPCMQQLFLGISPLNLAKVPFAPILTESDIVDAQNYLPLCTKAKLLIVPDISGYVGADTIACLLATRHYEQDSITLLVDIGTNGEMVLGDKDRMVACSTAAGPALEGAKIQFGMRSKDGAIDKVWLEDGKVCCHVIGDGPAVGICGSGLIDAVAVMLFSGAMNDRGRIQSPRTVPHMAEHLSEKNGQRIFFLTDGVYLTQQDIREVQLAKGAIAAGIEMMAEYMNIRIGDISFVQLAGAFGSAIRPESAARTGLIPPELLPKITAIGNAAGSGAKLLALNREELLKADALVKKIEHLDLASLESFQDTFVENMLFPTPSPEQRFLF